MSDLTDREDQVAALVCRGLGNKEIGVILGISSGAVKNHLWHIYKKKGIDRPSHSARALLAAMITQERKARKRLRV